MVRKRINDYLGENGGKEVPVDIRWEKLARERVFRIDTDQRVLILNSQYRRELLGDDRASAGDAPFLKTALFLLLSPDVIKERLTRKAEARLNIINACLIAAIEDELDR